MQLVKWQNNYPTNWQTNYPTNWQTNYPTTSHKYYIVSYEAQLYY